MRHTILQALRHGLSVLVLATLWTVPQAAAQRIVGTVADGHAGLREVQVLLMDVTSAVIVARVSTDENGNYDSGVLPAGSYRIHFSAINYLPKFYGSACTDTFCEEVFDLAVPVQADVGTTWRVDDSLIYAGVRPCVCPDMQAEGRAYDAQTSDPLEGIMVTVHDAISGLPLATCSTDASGSCRINEVAVDYSGLGKLRFSDPQLIYRPRYLESGGQDDFSLGVALRLSDSGGSGGKEELVKKSASDLVTDIIEIVPPGAEAGLTDSLGRALTLLTDGNPNNDSASCGVLDGVLQQIDNKERRGELTAEDAQILRQAVKEARNSLGC